MTKRKPEPWRNRIVGYADVAASDLSANPLNARLHPAAQRAALTAVLDDVGFVAPVIVNKPCLLDAVAKQAGLVEQFDGIGLDDDVPELPEAPVSTTGDIWILRSSCGPTARRSLADQCQLRRSQRHLPQGVCDAVEVGGLQLQEPATARAPRVVLAGTSARGSSTVSYAHTCCGRRSFGASSAS